MADFTMTTDANGIAVISWDAEGRSMNVLTREAFEVVEGLIDAALSDDAVKGIVITSAKKEFAGGMDLGVLSRIREEAGEDPAQALFEFTMNGHRILRKLERAGMDERNRGGKPVACAINGTCAGIGTEIALACHRRFMTDAPRARIGLPEILVGLFPGAGGTTRVSRMLGIMAAAPILLEGRMFEPAKARSAGLVDEVVPADELVERAKAWVREASGSDIVKPWDEKGWKMPGGAPYTPQGFMTFVGANAMVGGKTKGVYPAAKALLSAIYEGALVPFDTALRIEARHFTSVLLNPSSAAMIRSLFLNKQALEKGANRPDAPDQAVHRLGVLGAGMMGAGIAYVAANTGIEVVLLDREQAAADRGKAHAEGLLDKGIQRRKVTEEKKAEVLGRITATTDTAALDGCDLIVEAVFEDPAIKAEVTQAVQEAVGAEAVFATNTSTLPIGDLARASARPDRFIGIHFFSPVDKMMLVEIIKGAETGDVAVAKALDFVRQIRKTPIVVNDARFFYANRCIIPYINEGVRMVAEGVAPALVENAAKLLGFPLGPLQLIDETSIDLGVKIAKATRAAMGDNYPDGAVDDVLFWMADAGRLGRKAQAGFYAYDEGGKRQGLWDGLAERFPRAQEQPDLSRVQQRLMMAQVLEAVRAFETGVLEDIREGDVGAILGWGFAPWSGGPFGWLDMIGAPRAVEICETLETELGERFACPEILRGMAASDGTFYERFGDGAAAA
ncbi:3-hydroxyacyl-CoA dehydrogenase/enoyl-CoA hydratase/3-hydroxybutyryl-CoA epimerase [Palleronia aestuarii]|uniref:3-hydroxyacyl-CoA dehydrogenase/enoyl-CoA hydratase/3-hydroxybutyryl-CoA epimerase n=1 Tax=Palleronia aestuarii TaxID=568105 RepID=A0A2W7Q0E5_9RHOB|nr:3-hydroxyacyl-CoA dehydrogenase NAD-binding domain-containing protein [Palleronia aestuarii]PZX15249.1 3-hydroxyacyl-CoA dehydrogenase/enoyl-CoA hydratase/3-hydroxybutyryl-CoA epimerase [Palleronia aestuarii]